MHICEAFHLVQLYMWLALLLLNSSLYSYAQGKQFTSCPLSQGKRYAPTKRSTRQGWVASVMASRSAYSHITRVVLAPRLYLMLNRIILRISA